MFNVHIGLPGLQEDVFQNSVGWREADEPGSYLLSNAEYNENLAPFVNTRDKARTQADGLQIVASDFVSGLSQHPSVVISAPKILGSMSDAYATTTPFPRADGRIARITKLLSRHEVQFHLLIRRPFDYFFPPSTTVAPKILSAVLATGPTWLPLVERLRRSTLGRPINIWDLENPSRMAVRIRSSLLGPDFEEPNYDEDEDFTKAHLGLEKVNLPDFTHSGVLEAICILDDRYDAELDLMEALPGVNLFRWPSNS